MNTDNMTPLDYRLHLEDQASKAQRLSAIQPNPSQMGADELQWAMTQLNVTQVELAAMIGVDPSTVWRWVNASTTIPRPIGVLVRLLVDLK